MKDHKKEQRAFRCLVSVKSLLLAAGTKAAQGHFKTFDFLATWQRGNLHGADPVALHILDPATLAADEVMMMPGVRIEADAAALKDFPHHPRVLEPVERVVNRRPRSHREPAIDRRQHLIGSRMVRGRLQIIHNHAPLRRHLQPARLHHVLDRIFM